MRPTNALLAAALSLVLTACTPGDARHADTMASTAAAIVPRAPADSVHAPPATPADTMTVLVDGPTLVAFVPAGLQARMDADTTGEVVTVTDDFFHYLSEASDQLAGMQVALRVREADTLAFRSGARRWTWAPAADSSYVGYYLASPSRPPLVLYGVHVDDELVELVAGHLGTAVPRKSERR
jgi:hypothetical protein